MPEPPATPEDTRAGRIRRDLGLLVLFVLLFALAAFLSPLSERTFRWLVRSQHGLLDELLLVLAATTVAGAVFALRQWHELRREGEARRRIAVDLHHSERYHRALIENTADLITVLDDELRIRFQSPSIATVLGHPPDDVVGRALLELVHPDDRARVEQTLTRELQSPSRDFLTEYRVQHRDGDWRSLEAHGANRLRDPSVRGFVITARDVTPRRQTEEALQSANEALQAIISSAPLAIVAMDREGRVTLWNPAAERIFGWSAREALGQPPPYVPAEREAEFRYLLERALQGEGMTDLEAERHRRDGTPIALSISAAPLFDLQGRVRGVMTVNTDITERKHAERMLVQQEERFRTLIEGAADVILILEANGSIRYASPALASVLGYTPAEAVGLDFLTLVDPTDAPAFRDALEEVVGDPAHRFRLEACFRTREGETRFLVVRGRNSLAHPAVGGVVLNLRDTTERRRAEQELVRARDAAEAASRAKSEFLSSMSHELRTPLNSIIGFTNVLRRNKAGNLREQDLGYLERILANGRHLLGLISDLLDLSKIEAGKVAVDLAPVELPGLLRETVDELQGAARPGVALRLELPPRLEPIVSDARRLKQILINLTGNALKFTESGSVTVAVRADDSTGRPLEIEVSDTGIGIPADRLEAIFEAFEQAESGTSRRFGGTGLGLAISASLAQLLGHRIEVESEPGQGSTFRVLLSSTPRSGVDTSIAHSA